MTMIQLRDRFRRLIPATLLTAALLLLGAPWMAVAHHHDAPGSHGCVVCTTAHAPAIVSTTTAFAPAIRFPATLFVAPQLRAPCSIARGIAASRAPPLG